MSTKRKALSREEFLRVLRELGAHLGTRYCRANQSQDGIEEVQTAILSCPLDVWEQSFGKPRNVDRYAAGTNARLPQPYDC
ncbi:MAG: hypothetical protein JW888_17950 [Pirellulales bacterium]|nr:hypothetical protein [Pirellulales bacterium]